MGLLLAGRHTEAMHSPSTSYMVRRVGNCYQHHEKAPKFPKPRGEGEGKKEIFSVVDFRQKQKMCQKGPYLLLPGLPTTLLASRMLASPCRISFQVLSVLSKELVKTSPRFYIY